MTRLYRPRPNELNPVQRAIYDELVNGDRGGDNAIELVDDQGRLNGPFNAMVVSPEVGGPLGRLGAALRFNRVLSARAREIVILAVAAAKRSRYELFAHTRIARSAGLTNEEITELIAGRRPESFDPGEAAVLELTMRVSNDSAVTNDEFDWFRTQLGEPAIVEVTTLVGYYAMLAMQMTLFDVGVPDDVASA